MRNHEILVGGQQTWSWLLNWLRTQLSAVRINITQTVAEALKPLDLFAMRDLLWIFNKAPVCVPCLVNIGLQGIFQSR